MRPQAGVGILKLGVQRIDVFAQFARQIAGALVDMALFENGEHVLDPLSDIGFLVNDAVEQIRSQSLSGECC